MFNSARFQRATSLGPWFSIACGVAAGLLGALLLTRLTELRALIVLGALGIGFFSLVKPHIGLYVLTVAMIAQWPGGVIRTAGLAICGSALLWGLTTRRRLVPNDSIFWVQLMLTVVVWISTFQVFDRVDLTVTFAYTSFVALTWALPILCDRPRIMLRVIAVMLLSGVLIALIGFVQFKYPFVWIVSATYYDAASAFYSRDSVVDSLLLNGTLRVESLTGTPNYLAMTMQILLPFAVFWTIRRVSRMALAAGIAMNLMLLGAMALSFTRGVILTTALIVVPMLVFKIGLRRCLPYLFAGMLAASLVTVAWQPLRDRVVSTVTEIVSADPGTAAGWRIEVLPIGWQMFTDHFWTGVGLGQQRSLWHQYASTDIIQPGQETQLPLHNAYLLLAIDLGILGLLLFVALTLLCWRRARQAQRHFRATGQPAMLDMAHAAEIAWVAMAANNMMYPGLDSFRYYWVLLALIVAFGRIAYEQRERSSVGQVAYA